MTDLFIEGKRVDLISGLDHLLSYAVDDVKDIAHKQTNVSKTITLPGTANNNKIFGSIFDARVSNSYDSGNDNVLTNFNAAVSANCLMFQNRMQVFKGTLRLLEIVIDGGQVEYEVAVFGELGGFTAALGALRLEDLDFSAYDRVLNVSGITASWDSLNGSGVCFPVIDYGTVSSNKQDYSYRAFRPALFVKEYVEKIIQDSGYTHSCDLFETTRFKSLIVPFNQKELQTRALAYGYADRDSTTTVVTNAITQANVSFEDFMGTDITANVDKSEFTYTGASTAIFRVTWRITGVHVLTYAPTYLRIRKNNTDVIPNTIKVLDLGTGNYVWEGSVEITLAQNDYIAMWYYWGTVGVGSQNDVTVQTASLDIESITPVYSEATIGSTIEMVNCIPKNVLQRDFISSIIKLFNLYVYEDNLVKKKLYFKPYVDFYDLNPSGVTNWNQKLDRSRQIRLRPMSELNSRYYGFKFKDDNDYYNELHRKKYGIGYGNLIYDSAFEFANDSEDIPVIFSPTVLVGYAGEDKVVSTIFKQSAGVEEEIDSNIRILQAKKITGVTSWDIKNGVLVLSSNTSYLYAGHYDDPDAPANDIHFGVPDELYFTLATGAINVTQFNVYWSPYMAEITDKDSKLMICYMKLENSDIFNLDFSKPVYVDGSYWRINRIVDWNAVDPDVCVVELLKIINLVY